MRVSEAEQEQFEWARGLNPRPNLRIVRTQKEETLIERGLRLLRGGNLPHVDDDIAAKRRRERAEKGIITVGRL